MKDNILFLIYIQPPVAFLYKDDFNKLFGSYYIGKHPTSRANKYYVLHFDFSGIDTTTPENTFNLMVF